MIEETNELLNYYICSFCEDTVSAKAERCPSCRSSLKRKWSKIIMAISRSK